MKVFLTDILNFIQMKRLYTLIIALMILSSLAMAQGDPQEYARLTVQALM
jgi:hypothetical protein